MPQKKSKKSIEERRVSFSNNPLNKIDQSIDERDQKQNGFNSKNGAVKDDRLESAHKKEEEKKSEETAEKKLVVEDIPGSMRFRQRQGAITDEHTHKLMAQEAVVCCTLQISGFGFYA